MKSREEIRAETPHIQIPRSANYEYGKKVPEWDASLPNTSTLTRESFIRNVEPHNDRILVQLLNEPQTGRIVLTDHKPLIGGCRKAKVLKIGPGRWIPGEWWKVKKPWLIMAEPQHPYDYYDWQWFPGYRQAVSVQPGDIVLIGNWVDLEMEDIALCQEMDIRSIWQN